MPRKRSRTIITWGTVAVLAAVLVFAFWPRPTLVDMGAVTRGQMTLTVDEEGRTRVHDAYVLATPVAGRLLRVDVLPGDAVVGGETVVAQMLPSYPTALDLRSRAQAQAGVTAAEAALRLARAELNKASADHELARTELQRNRQLRADGAVSAADLDRAVRTARVTEAQLGTATATIAMRQAELANARAALISFRDTGPTGSGDGGTPAPIPLYAPATGQVLQRLQESETTLPAGTAIMAIGNVGNDLEVVVELLSTDAVRVSPGDRVIFEGWGGPGILNGVVDRVEPFGFTKFSALGVEEQRVNTIIRFADPPAARRTLGHGYRVEARIVVWEDANALIVPSSALFRDGKDWVVFRVRDGKARLQHVGVGRNNGIEAQVVEGLAPGDQVILYPPAGLTDGAAVAQRKTR